MLIVNTTYHVAETCDKAWQTWVKNAYVPEIVKTGLLVRPRFFRLLIEDEPGTKSYALQFEVTDFQTLERWFQQYGVNLQQTMSNQFHEKVLGFTTLMENQPLESGEC